MATLFLQYPACSTCQKAKKWLTENNIEFTNRLIVEENPTVEELKAWIPRSGLPVKKFFNTSGLVYKELKLSEKLPAMSEEEQIALLATNGKLVKRPLVVTDSFVLVGFKFDRFVSTQWSRNIIRAKGVCYFSNNRDMSFLFEQAGVQKKLKEAGLWYATAPEEELIEVIRQEPGLLRDWDDKYGDRMQKIVFIGRHLDKEELIRELDECLE